MSSWAWAASNLLTSGLGLGIDVDVDSRISGALVVDTVLFRKLGFGTEVEEAALPDRLPSSTGFLAFMGGPEERVGCTGTFGRPTGGVGPALAGDDVPALKRAIMAFTSVLLSWQRTHNKRSVR